MIPQWYYLSVRVFTKNTEYAIHALAYIASRRGIIPAQELARELDIPQPFLRRILRDLGRCGVIESVRGQKGGFRLQKKPENIRLLDVMRVFQGPVRVAECTQTPGCAQEASCTIRENIVRIEQGLVSSLQNTTLASLLSEGEHTIFTRSIV